MEKKAWIISSNRSAGDNAVTLFYLEIIKQGFRKCGIECEFWKQNEKLSKDDILIFDEYKNAFLYLLKGYRNIAIWFQGIVPEEAIMQGYSKLRYYIISVIEKIILLRANLIFFCSEYMKEHYRTKYKLDIDNYIVMPCFNESDVIINKDEGNEENSFLYVGSLKPWQCFEQTLDLYKQIEEKSKQRCHLYVYTSDQAEAISKIQGKGIINYTVDYAQPHLLGKKIEKLKYGFVIREDIEVNRVATPTKLSNYISHGIIPIYSSCLRSFHKYNTDTQGLAIVCDIDHYDIDKIVENIEKNITKAELSDWCNYVFSTYYNYKNYIEEISVKVNKMR